MVGCLAGLRGRFKSGAATLSPEALSSNNQDFSPVTEPVNAGGGQQGVPK
jgi:hypothetical protein